MSKFKEILTGWANLVFGNKEIKKMASERMAVCARCPHASAKMYLHCDVCGCYIPAKARSRESDCPLNFWL